VQRREGREHQPVANDNNLWDEKVIEVVVEETKAVIKADVATMIRRRMHHPSNRR